MQKKTNRGKMLDMDALFQQNESAVAVTGGGPSMNARGDMIGVGGKVIKRLEQREKENSAMERPKTQKVKLSQLNKFSNLIGDDKVVDHRSALKDQLQREKEEARKRATRLQLDTSSMANNGQPVITDHTKNVKIEKPTEEPSVEADIEAVVETMEPAVETPEAEIEEITKDEAPRRPRRRTVDSSE